MTNAPSWVPLLILFAQATGSAAPVVNVPVWVQYAIPFTQAFGPAVGWLLVIIGWRTVSKDNNKRERRKEIRALLNEARTAAIELEHCAYEYYQKHPTDSGELSTKIKRELQHLSKTLLILKKINSNLYFDSSLQEFRQKLTGQDFDVVTRVPRSHSDRLFLEISTATLELTSAFEDKFSSIYS